MLRLQIGRAGRMAHPFAFIAKGWDSTTVNLL